MIRLKPAQAGISGGLGGGTADDLVVENGYYLEIEEILSLTGQQEPYRRFLDHLRGQLAAVLPQRTGGTSSKRLSLSLAIDWATELERKNLWHLHMA